MDNHDFLDGIDEQFQQLMKLHGNGKSNGHARSRPRQESITGQILDELAGLTRAQREEVLAFIHSLKQKVRE
jgi:hypothetical protein